MALKQKAIFVGRFQPFHKGHLNVVKKLAKKYKLVVVIGSAEKHDLPRNPFTSAEREEMIKAALAAEKIKGVKIIKIPDCNNDKKWAADVINRAGKAYAVVSGNPWVWKSLKPYGVRPLRLPFSKKFSSTKIRAAMRSGKPWKQFVPKGEVAVLRKICVKRVLTKLKF